MRKKVRGVAALNTMTISIFYMIAQLVGAGALIKLLLGIEYTTSVLIVGTLMTVYVIFWRYDSNELGTNRKGCIAYGWYVYYFCYRFLKIQLQRD